MAVRRTTIEEEVESQDPKIVRSTKKVINPDIHHPIVEDSSVEVNDPEVSTIKHTRVVHEPLVETENPQEVYEVKKLIYRFHQIIWYVLTALEVLLGFRLTLKAIGANPFSGFTSFIYSFSDPLTLPFSGIVRPSISGNSVIEWSTIIAAMVYFVIAIGIASLIHMAKPVTPEEVDREV